MKRCDFREVPEIKLKYTAITILIMAIICSATIFFFLFSLAEVGNIYIGKTDETILELKKDFIKDTVNNLIAEIDNQRNINAQLMETATTKAAADIEGELVLERNDFLNFIEKFFGETSEYEHWTVVYWDRRESRAVYDNHNMSEDTWESTLQHLEHELAVYRVLNQGDKTVLLGVKKRYGHDVGDAVLIEIVEVFNDVIRSSDKVIRWGGDEFLIIFYGLQPRNAIGFGNKILSIVSTLHIEVNGERISPTLSAGVAFFQETDTDFNDALKRADQSLYQAKTNGRNQVHIDL